MLSMEVEQTNGSIEPHRDTYIQGILMNTGRAPRSSKSLESKNALMQPGVALEQADRPETPDPREQKMHPSFMANLRFAGSWVRAEAALPRRLALCFATRTILRPGRTLDLGMR